MRRLAAGWTGAVGFDGGAVQGVIRTAINVKTQRVAKSAKEGGEPRKRRTTPPGATGTKRQEKTTNRTN